MTNSPGARDFPHLLSPFRIGDVYLANRFVFQPHFTALTIGDGLPNDALRAYFVERALGRTGLIIDGHMTVMVEGMMAPHYLRAWEERIIPAYRPIADELHANGTRVFGQLTHSGHTTLTEPPQDLWAPTQMPEPSSRYTTRAMDRMDIRRTVERFGLAARNLIAAGVDGIEVKIAHDGLLRSFVSPYFNRRTDEYGGSAEKRMRLPLEVLASIREAVGPGVPLGIRLCLDEYTPFGYHLDEGLRIAERFEASGLVDYFNCDAGTFSSFWMEIPPAAVEQGHFRPLNRALKQQSSLAVIAFGRIKDVGMAERILELGEADLIGMARPLIADPDLPRKLAEGRADEIRACIGCNDGCIHQVMQVKPIRCIQNPGAGQERQYSDRLLVRTDRPKSVVVVGAGVAGLKVAEIAARRGHRVTLLERAGEVGGQVRLAARQPLHQEIGEVVAYLDAAVKRLGVELWLNADADAEGLMELGADVIVIATGSQPDLPPGHLAPDDRDAGAIARSRGMRVPNAVPGLDRPCVRSIDQVLTATAATWRRALVIDAHGHWEAAGTAEYLADNGCAVEVVTSRAEVGFGLEAGTRVMFHERARDKGIAMTPSTAVRSIEDDGAVVVDLLSGRERRLGGFDLVVPVYPRASRDDLYFDLLDRLGDESPLTLLRIGDASAPRLIQTIMVEAQQIAMEL